MTCHLPLQHPSPAPNCPLPRKQVSIPRLEINGATSKFVVDGGSSSSSSSSGSVTAATDAAALSGVSSRARGWQGTAGVRARAASPCTGEVGTTALLVELPSDGENGGIAPGNGDTTVSAANVAASSGAARAEGGVPLPFSTSGTPEGTLDQPPPQPPTPPSRYVPLVEVHVNEEGGAEYRFCKSAPNRRGKWSRMEEEYAKR